MDAWQREDFEVLDNGWRRAMGLPIDESQPVFRRAYLERGRGSSKSTDLAVSATAALLFSQFPSFGIVAAADKDQAGILRSRISRLASLNSWYGSQLDISNWRIANRRNGASLQILSADAPTAYGLLADWVVCDELTNWRGRDLWDAVFSTVAKRKLAMLVVISNAGLGMGTSWQWKIRETCRLSPDWHFRALDGPASWIDRKNLEEQQRLWPPKIFARLWKNEWSPDRGDALDFALIDRACVLDGPLNEPEPGLDVVLGLDLGLAHDHAALVGIGCDIAQQKLRLVHTQVWKPQDYPGGRIRLKDVEEHTFETARRLRALGLVADPWQCIRTLEELTDHGLPCYQYPFTSGTLREMAVCLVNSFANRTIELYRDERLIQDLSRVSIIEKQTGVRLEFPRDREAGHLDLGTAFCICLRWSEGTLPDTLDALGIPRRPNLQFEPTYPM